MNTIYRGSNGCYYTDGQVWYHYERGFWQYKEIASGAGREVVETSSGRTVTIVPTRYDSFPFDLPGPELTN